MLKSHLRFFSPIISIKINMSALNENTPPDPPTNPLVEKSHIFWEPSLKNRKKIHLTLTLKNAFEGNIINGTVFTEHSPFPD